MISRPSRNKVNFLTSMQPKLIPRGQGSSGVTKTLENLDENDFIFKISSGYEPEDYKNIMNVLMCPLKPPCCDMLTLIFWS
jgi:hypothetical protein